jgi:hypothetical protein
MTEVVYDNTCPLPIKYLHPILISEITQWKESMLEMSQPFGGFCETEPVAIPPMMLESFMYYIRLMFSVVMDRACRSALILEKHPMTMPRFTTQARFVWRVAAKIDSEMKELMEEVDDFATVMAWNSKLIATINKLCKETSLMNFLLVPKSNVIADGWGVFVLLSERHPFLPPPPDELAVHCTSCIIEEIERGWESGRQSFFERVLLPLHQDDWQKKRRKRERDCQEEQQGEEGGWRFL